MNHSLTAVAARFLAVSLIACLFCAATTRADDLPITPREHQTRSSADGVELPSWSKSGTALAITLAVVVAGLCLTRRVSGRLSGEAAGGQVQVISQAPLGSRGMVYVLRCGPRVLVVGSTVQQLTTLAEIADPDEIAQFVAGEPGRGSKPSRLQTGSPASQFKGQLHGMLDKIENWGSPS